MSLYTIELEFDGEYRSRLMNQCRTIRDSEDLVLLCRTINLMIFLNVSTRDISEKKNVANPDIIG
jgi:hypothetical protein